MADERGDAPGGRGPYRARPGAAVVTDGAERRMLGWELLVVLAVFPLPQVVAALQSLASSVVDGAGATPYVTLPIPGHAGLSAPLVVAALLLPLAGVALVGYLLARSDGGWSAIGLGGGRPLVQDLADVLPVFTIAELLGIGVTGVLLAVAGVHGVKPPEPRNLPIGYLAVFVVASIVTAVAEEVVVLGYLVRRLEQRGWRPAQVVAVAAAVRISYHLYYGVGVLPIAVWAVLSVVLYRTYRRLPAFIVVHAVWDATLFAQVFVGGAVVALVALLIGVPSIVIWGVDRRRRATERQAAAGMPAPYPMGAYPGTAYPPVASPSPPNRQTARAPIGYPRTAHPGIRYPRTGYVGPRYPVVPEPVPPGPAALGPSSPGPAADPPPGPAPSSPPGPGPSAWTAPGSSPPPDTPPSVPPPS